MGSPSPSWSLAADGRDGGDHDAPGATPDPLEPLLHVRRILTDMLEDCERYSAMVSRLTQCSKTENGLLGHPHGGYLRIIPSR